MIYNDTTFGEKNIFLHQKWAMGQNGGCPGVPAWDFSNYAHQTITTQKQQKNPSTHFFPG